MKKMTLNNLCVEVTRRCNMTCEHCLRGRAQNCDFDVSLLDPIFSQVDYISDFTITGGEPSLVPHIINQICDKLESFNVSIGRFYIATNAKQITNEFLLVLMRLYLLCDDTQEGLNMVEWSNDAYHDCEYLEGSKRLSVFKFAGPRYSKDGGMINGISEGRGKTYFGKNGRKPSIEDIEISEWEDRIGIEGTLYLNCKGRIVSDCDFSYHNQDKEGFTYFVCMADEFCVEKIQEYVDRILALKQETVEVS